MTRLLALALVLTPLAAGAQPSRTLPDDPWCERADNRTGGTVRACEVRETVVQADALDLSAEPNGSVSVTRWDRADVLVRAVVAGYASDREAAERLVDQTRVRIDGGRVRTEPPPGGWTGERRWATVSLQVFAPRATPLAARTTNGSVEVAGIEGDVQVATVNGSVRLVDVGGDVRARTVNGSVAVALSGPAWAGRGLDAQTTNGSVALTVPRGFSADLSAQTQMGRIATSGLAVADADRQRGRWMGDQIRTRLGRGGPPVRLATVNGGVSIREGS